MVQGGVQRLRQGVELEHASRVECSLRPQNTESRRIGAGCLQFGDECGASVGNCETNSGAMVPDRQDLEVLGDLTCWRID